MGPFIKKSRKSVLPLIQVNEKFYSENIEVGHTRAQNRVPPDHLNT